MPDILSVLQKVKDILSQEVGERKVFDKDVAEALGINQLTLATMKNRAKIPYKEILEFCAKRKISINWVLFDQVVESLQAETDKFAKIHYFKDIYASAGLEKEFDREALLSPLPWKGTIIPLLTSKKKEVGVSPALLNGYAELVEEIAQYRKIELESAIGSANKTTINLVRVLLYSFMAIVIVLIIYRRIKSRG